LSARRGLREGACGARRGLRAAACAAAAGSTREGREEPRRHPSRRARDRRYARRASIGSAAAGAVVVYLSERIAAVGARHADGACGHHEGRSMKKVLPLFASVLLAHAAAAETLERQAEAPAKGEVEIVNVSGEVRVIGWDRAQVRLHADLDGDVETVEFER